MKNLDEWKRIEEDDNYGKKWKEQRKGERVLPLPCGYNGGIRNVVFFCVG